jgi:hypothetical protein
MLGELKVQTPLGRIAAPDETAAVALFLASDNSSFMSGSEVFVDGGWRRSNLDWTLTAILSTAADPRSAGVRHHRPFHLGKSHCCFSTAAVHYTGSGGQSPRSRWRVNH